MENILKLEGSRGLKFNNKSLVSGATLYMLMIDIALGIIFFTSIIAFWYRLSIKIPELIAVPDEVIAMRLEEDSAKIQLFFLHFKVFFREKWYKKNFFRICERTLHRMHIIAMRFDNAMVRLLKKVRENGNGDKNGEQASEPLGEEKNNRIYWSYLKKEETPEIIYTASEEAMTRQKRAKRKI